MAFTHIFPGLVRTALYVPSNPILKLFYPLIYAATYFAANSAGQAAEFMLHALLEGENGSFRRGPDAGLLKNEGPEYFSTEEAKQKLWDQTVQITTLA